MTAKTRTCVVLVCDDCGKSIDIDMDGGIRHFDSAEEAREEINDRFDEDYAEPVSIGGVDLCGSCRTKPHGFAPIDRPYRDDARCMRCLVERDEHDDAEVTQ